jgi:hypothetical protein
VDIALFLLPAAMALTLVGSHHRPDIATVTILVSVGLGLPVLWLAWATFRVASRSGTTSGIGPGSVVGYGEMTVGQLVYGQPDVAGKRYHWPRGRRCWPGGKTCSPIWTRDWRRLMVPGRGS